MPLPKNINTYADIAPILETARKEGGAIYTLSSGKEATRWRQRAYYFRTLLFERDGFTPYDTMKLIISDDTIVTITFDIAAGTLRSLTGKELKPDWQRDAHSKLDNELTLAAEKLSKQLEGK